MPKPKKITHYCQACETKHIFTENVWPFWNHRDGLYWCNKGIDCAGCKTIHRRTGITKSLIDNLTGKTYSMCNKWFKKTGNGEIQWENWSPQEVMSGVHFGEERVKRYGKDTEDHTIVQSGQVKALGEALDEIEGY